MDAFQLDKDFPIHSHQEDPYYNQYCRLYLANVALTSQMKDLIQQKHQLQSRLRQYEDEQLLSHSQRHSERSKRMRRNANEIERYYKCTVKVCGKSYGSEGSLNQHYKLKHPEIYATLPNVQSNCSHQQAESRGRDKENKHRYANNKQR